MPTYTPDYTQDPGDADLIALLTAAGLYNTQIGAFLPGYVAGAVTRFEKATGRRPFLAGDSETFTLDPPGPASAQRQNIGQAGGKILELRPYFTTITQILVGYSIDNPAGTVVDLQRDVYFKPDNHAALGDPIEWIEFLWPIRGLKQSIQITGTPGSYNTWPLDAWQGVLAYAAMNLSAVIGASISGGLTSSKELDVDESYAANPMAAFELAWKRQFDIAVAAYKIVRMGL